MKFLYLTFLAFALSLSGKAQVSTTSATFSTGDVSSDNQGLVTTANTSPCAGILTVNVPAGRYVTGVEVEYNYEARASGNAWISEQRSYLECVTTSTKESSVALGTASSNFSGTKSYDRPGLTIANGIVPSGGLQFKLHLFRTFGGGGCGTNFQRVLNNTYKVTVTHAPAPTCPPPSSLVVNAVTTTSANLSWTSGGASAWQIEYGPVGFAPGSGTLVNALANPFNLTGLSASTAYEVRVRDSCGLGDVSFWSSVANFKTACSVVSLPWVENFSSPDWVAGDFNDIGEVDTCFQRNWNNPFSWQTGPRTFSSNFSGPSGDHTTGSGKYMYSEPRTGFTSVPDTAVIISPPIDLSTVALPRLTFWYHMYGTNIGNLKVLISDNGGGSYTSVFTKNGQQQNSKTVPWQEAIVDLAAYTMDTVLIKFQVIQSNFGNNGDVSIDDIRVAQKPSCAKPFNVFVQARKPASITLGWTTGGASNWQIEYGPPGFSLGNGTIINANAQPFTVSGLSPGTAYDFYVRDSCSATDVSAWSQKVSSITHCTVSNAPYSKSFEGLKFDKGTFNNDPGTIDTCWTRTPLGDFFFKTGPAQFTNSTGSLTDHTLGTTSGKYLYTERVQFGGTNGDTTELISDLIGLTPLTVPELSFWYHMYGADIGSLNVLISSNFGASYTSVYTRSGQQQNSSSAPWKEAIINLAAYANDTILIKFRATDINIGFNAHTCIDDLDIHEAPTCPKPQDFRVDLVWHDRATFSWTTGGASQWEIEYGSPNFTPGNGTRAGVFTNPGSISGLTPNTNYEAYIRDSCAVGDVSVWVGPVSFRTKCLPTAAPYSEDFSASGFSAGPNFNSPGTLDPCWARDPQVDYVWKGGPPPFTTFNTGPDKDHTTGLSSGKYIYTGSLTFVTNLPFETNAYSELVDVSTLTTPELSFWYHMYGVGVGDLEVSVANGSGTWTQVWSKSGQQQNSKADAWKEAVVNLSAFAGDTIILRFKAIKTLASNQAELAIDDVDIHEQPSCPKPQNLEIVGITNSTVVLQWQSGGAANWQVEYGGPGFTPGSGTLVNAPSNPFTVTGLSPNTAYKFYVRDSCGAGDVSSWVGPVRDTTDCNPVAAPYTQTFDGPAFTIGTFSVPGNLNSCWRRIWGPEYMWTPESNNFNFGTGPDADHTSGSGKFLMTDRFFGNNMIQGTMTTLYSPLIDLSPLSIPEMTFWYHMFGVDIDSLGISVFDGATWTHVATLVGQQQNTKAEPWKEMVVNLSAFAGDTIKLRFEGHQATVFGNQNNISIDDLDIHEQPSCPKPSQLSVTSTAATSVTLAWTTGGATDWQIEYGPSGFTPGSGIIVNANTNPFTVTGLNSSTTFDFYIRDSCGINDVSLWYGPATGATDCLPLLAPFTESFDGAPWQAGPNFNDTGSIANCWIRTPLTDYVWRSGPPPFTQFGTGPAADHTTGSGKYIFTETIFSGGNVPFTTFLETPQIDLTALNVPELSFWYHMYGSAIGTFTVEIDDGSGYTSIFTKTGQQQTSDIDDWKEAIVSLAAYANDTVRLRFKANKATFNTQSDVALDDIDIHEEPSCPQPTNLTSISTSDGFILNWTSGGATNWQVEYGPVGFTPGTGSIVNVPTNPFTLTGLSANTVYDLYLRDSCSATELSDWLGPKTDTTLCSVFLTPFSENFDGAAWVPGILFNDPGDIDQCWYRSDTVNYHWRPNVNTTQSFNSGPSQDHTTGNGKYLYTESSGGNNSSSIFSSPLFDLSPLTAPELRFWYHMYGADIDKLEVEVWDGSSWTLEATITGQQQTSSVDPWQEKIVSLASYVNDTVQVRFRGYKVNFGFDTDISLDDFWIGEAPTCPRPSNITIGATTTTSMTISWTTGGATQWLIGYKPTGSPGPLTIVPAATNPFTINGLNPSTSYSFYVKDSCALGDVSLWEGPESGTTQCGIVNAPWAENFDGNEWVSGTGAANAGNAISPCWSRPNANNPNFSPHNGPTTSAQTGPNGDVSGSGKYIYTEASNGGVGTGSISSPQIFIPAGLNNPRLKFSYHIYGSAITSFGIEINSGTGFTNVFSFTGQQQFSNADPWKVDSVSLSSYSGNTIQIKFLGTNTGFLGDVAIDELIIKADPSNCPPPGALSFSTITSNSANIAWNSGSNMSDVEIVPTGQAQGSGDLSTNSTSPMGANGLQPNTSYTVYVRDSCGPGSFSTWISGSFVTTACPVVTAAFGYNTNLLSVAFNSSASVNADTLIWDFGDGSTGAGATPAHAYAAPGTYQVTLVAGNSCGTGDTIVQSFMLCDTLQANFTTSQQGDTIYFDASLSKGMTNYYWDLGNGSDTTGVQFGYAYSGTSNRTVVLTVVNACGDSATFSKVIKVCQPPIASWTYTVISTTGAGMEVQFDGSASQNATSYEWDFGDGNKITGQVQPIHLYLTPGLFYKVSLKVANACGDQSVKAFRLNQIGLDEYELGSMLQLFPNPAQDEVTVEWDTHELKVQKLEITDVAGRVVREILLTENQAGKKEVDISGLSDGYYFIRIETDHGSDQRRLLKQ